MNFRKAADRHPGMLWALGAVEYVIVDAFLILGIIGPAWAAAVTIPLGGRTITINLGDLPAWIVAFVAAGGFWKAWRAEKIAKAVDTKLAEVGVKIDGLLVARDAAKVKEGQEKEKIVGANAADQLAKGVEQGIAQERASVAAANPLPSPQAGIAASDKPVAVADERTGAAVERIADATTIASERSADAVERLADVVRTNKEPDKKP